MQTYTVHELPEPKADRIDRAEDLVFVKDGFSWPTFIFAPLGFIQAKLWVELIVYLVAMSLLGVALDGAGMSPAWISLIITAIGAFLAFEISSLHRASLDRRGWTIAGTVSGKSWAECERRFFEGWLPDQPMIRPPASAHADEGRAATLPSAQSLWRFSR